jgi:tRNA (guanine-N7-)-methyltransferase
MPDNASSHLPFRFYGRRKARTPTPLGLKTLEEGREVFAVDVPAQPLSALASLFKTPFDQYTLEIGFGGGEHLLHRASNNPTTGFLGAEAFQDGVLRVYRECFTQQLENVRVFPDDIRLLWDSLPPASFSRIYVLFPDPWPKKRHLWRRLLQTPTFTKLAELLAVGGVLYCATDIPDYAEQMQAEAVAVPTLQQKPKELLTPFAGYVTTKYHQKAMRAGRTAQFMEFERIP